MQGANGKHPFLGNMCLWVQPRKYFLEGQVPCREFSLGWDRQKQVRKLYPAGRVMEPDSRSVKKEIPLNPIYLPGVKTTVRMLCSNMALVGMRAASPPALVIPAADRQAQRVRGNVVATTSRVQVEDLKEPSPTEEISLGDDIEIDWDWWGSSKSSSTSHIFVFVVTDLVADGEAEDETIEAEDFRPRPLASTSTPLPATPSKGLRYHPCKLISPDAVSSQMLSHNSTQIGTHRRHLKNSSPQFDTRKERSIRTSHQTTHSIPQLHLPIAPRAPS